MLHLGPPVGNGYHPYVRHRPGCHIEAGILRKTNEHGNDEAGAPIDGIMRIRHTGHGDVYDVESIYERAPSCPTDDVAHEGPAMVSSEAYRDGWSRIFGNKAVGQA